MKLTFRIKTAGSEDVLRHLQICNATFSPVLSSRVDLSAYAEKLTAHAVTFEAWRDLALVGLVGGYFNDFEHRNGYISTVSTVPESRGEGIARRLLEMALDYAAEHGFRTVLLEVEEANVPAQNLYQQCGFHPVGRKGIMIQMEHHN